MIRKIWFQWMARTTPESQLSTLVTFPSNLMQAFISFMSFIDPIYQKSFSNS